MKLNSSYKINKINNCLNKKVNKFDFFINCFLICKSKTKLQINKIFWTISNNWNSLFSVKKDSGKIFDETNNNTYYSVITDLKKPNDLTIEIIKICINNPNLANETKLIILITF